MRPPPPMQSTCMNRYVLLPCASLCAIVVSVGMLGVNRTPLDGSDLGSYVESCMVSCVGYEMVSMLNALAKSLGPPIP
jgi:hypothetical protein